MRYIIAIAIACLLFGCSDKSATGIIPQQKMEKLLLDIMQVDEFVTEFVAKDTTKDLKKERIKLYQKVFRLHDVSEKQFSASFNYYSSKPDIMKIMFDTIGAIAQRQREYLYLPKDSIRK